MELRDALKMLRGELGLTQMELANALHVNFSTVGRWENGRTLPNRAMAAALIEFARTRAVSSRCAEGLKQALQNVAKSKLDFSSGNLYAVEHASLSEFIDSASFPIYVCDLHTDDILYFNRKAEELIGCALTELPDRKCYRCIMHRDTPCDFCHKNMLVEDRFVCHKSQRFPNGESYNVQGKRIQWNGHEAQIRYIVKEEPSEQLQAIIENINGGVSVVVYANDGSVRLAYANDHYYQIFGYTKEQYRAELRGVHDTVFPEDIEHVRTEIQKVRLEHQAVSFKYRIVKRDGSIARVRCSSSITQMESLGGMVMISVITDITASEKTELEALINGQRLKAIMDNINNGVVATTMGDDGKVQYVFVTDGYYEMLGFTREQYQQEVTDPFSLICAEDRDEVRKAATSLGKKGKTKTLTYRVTRRDGRKAWFKVDITMMTFTDVDKPVQLSVFTDVTDTVEANEKLALQNDQIGELLNTTPGGIAIIEVDPKDVLGSLRTTYYNDNFFSYSGYSRQEYEALHQSNELCLVFDEDAPLLVAVIEKMLSSEIGTTADASVRCHVKTGGYRWMLLTGQLVERRGEICIIHIVSVDITKRKDAEDKQRINEEMLRVAAETDKRAIIVYDVKANTCHVESRMLFSSRFGETISNIPQSLIDTGIVSKETSAELCSLFEQIRKGEPNMRVSLLMRTGDDEYQWFECNAPVIFDADGQPDHAVLVFHNITEQRIKEAVFTKWKQSIEQRPPESYTLFRCNLSRDASLDQQDGTLLKIVFSADDMSFNQRTREYVERYVYPEDSDKYIALLDSDTLLAMFYRNEHATELEYREMDENGALAWRRLTVELVEYLNSTDVQAFLLYEDIDEKKRAELREKELAETDPLTGALNRVAFSEKAGALIASEPTTQHALIMMDMDGFKLLNDRFGHAAGDQALMDVAATLRTLTRDGDLVCRLGGDEFVIWLRNIPYDAVIDKIAKQISEQVRKAFSAEVQISASLGIAVYPRDGHDFDELYHKADKALYNVKRAGKDSYAFFSVTDEALQPDNSYTVAAPRPVPKTPARIKRRMLIVDDNETNRVLLQRIFQDEYLIEMAKNGTEAMIRLRHFGASISVALLDLAMPGMDGFEVLERMQDNTELRAIPVIIVSSDERHETLLKAIDNGAADYVTKPIDNDVIRIRVRSAVSKAENERLRAQNSYLQLQREEELKFRTVLESTGTVVVEYDWRNHVFIYDNMISNYIAGSYSNRSLWTVFLSDMVADSNDVKRMQELVLSLANNRETNKASRLVKLNTPANGKHWFRMNVYKQVDDFGLAEKMIITFNDIHEEVLTNDRLQYQATHDELTGLYNRAGFIEQAEKLVSRKAPGYYVMACIDIDKFKVINDQYGTKKGDEVLRGFADALLQINGGKDCVCCRIMADNFAVLYPQRLVNALELTNIHHSAERLDGSLPPLKMYIGRCVVDDPSLPISAIYDRAFIAKDTVKGRYDEYIATYNESMRMAILRQQEIIGQMNSALKSGQFEVWLQPQFNHTTGMLAGAEALVRWRHPKEGLISPAEFIPIFERNGFVYEVDKFVWEQTCILLKGWLERGFDPVPVSVNISRYDVFRDDIIDVIKGLVKKYDLPANLLRLEITESAFSESTGQIIHVVEKLVELGFVVEIDDFGSGYSSLNTLKDVPAQVLKMDMRFLENDNNAQRGGSIIESVIRMAKWLGMSVIAEGVETIEQADFLKSIGCEYIQGYLYSRPAQVAEYEKLFTEERTEAKHGQLKTAETWNNNAFWNPKSMETLIFNSYVGGACIFEYHNGKTELLRYNSSYADIFGDSFKHLGAHKDILEVLDDGNKALLQDTMDKAMQTKKESTCEMEIASNTGTSLYIRSTMRQIASAGNRSLFYCVINDITEQRAAERAERETASRIAAVMDNMDGGITAVCTRNGRPELIFSNDRYYSQLGYTREQFNQEVPVYFDAIHPDDRQKVWGKVRETITSKAPGSIEYRCVKRDGSIIHIRGSIALCHIDGIDGEVMVTVETDITELVKAQKTNARTSKRLQVIMDSMSGGVAASVVRDGKVDYLFANNRYYELLGYDKDEYETKFTGSFNAIHPDDRERTNAVIRQATKDHKPYSVEFRVVRKDGSIRWLFCNISLVSLPDIDEPVHLAAVNDTTVLHEAQQKELEAADRIRAVMDNATCGITAVIMRKDKTVEYLLVNDKYFDLLGYTREQYAEEGLQGLELMHSDDARKLEEQIVGLDTVGQTGTFEFRAKRRDGSWVWLRNDIAVISLSGIEAPVQLSCFADVTAQKEADERLRFVNELASDILSEPDCNKAIHDTLERLLAYFGAQRSYIVELDQKTGLTNNTYEVCAPGTASAMERLHGIPFSEADYWYTALKKRNFFKIADVERLDESQSKLKALLRMQDIHSLILAPLWRDGQLIGFAGVDNPSTVTEQVERLTAPADYLAVLLTRRDLDAKINDENQAILAVMNGIPGGFARLQMKPDGTLRALYYSDGYSRLVGMTKAQISEWMPSNDVFAWIHPDDIAIVKHEIEKVLSGKESNNVLYRLRHGKTGYVWISGFAKMRRSESGEVYLNVYYSDATEQKKTEALRLELLDNLPCGAALYEYDGKNLTVKHLNRHYWEMVERAATEYQDVSFINAVHPDDRTLIARELAAAIQQERDFSADIRVVRGDGSYKPFHITGNIILQSDGKYLIYAAYTPISDEVMSIQGMLPIAMSAMMDSRSDIAFIKDSTLRYVTGSRAFAAILGFADGKDIAGKSDKELLPAEYRKAYAAADEKVLKTGLPLLDYEETVPEKDGTVRRLVTSKYPLLDTHGHTIGIYGISRDVTAERETSFELNTLLNVIPSGVLKYSADEREQIAYINRNFVESLGYTREQFADKFGDCFRELIYAEDRDRVETAIQQEAGNGQIGKYEYRIETADGELRWFHDEGVKVTDQDGRSWYYVTLVDITERKLAEDRLRVSEEENRLAVEHGGSIVTKFDVATRTLKLPSTLPAIYDLPLVLYNMPQEQIALGRVSPETADAYAELFESIVRGSRTGEATYCQDSTKGWRWLEARYTTIFSSDGKPVSAVITFTDITEQLEKEVVYSKWQQSLTERPEDSYTLFRCNLSRNASYDSWEGKLLTVHFDDVKDTTFNDRTAEFAAQCVYEGDRDSYLAFMNADSLLAGYYRGHRSATLEFREAMKDGTVRWLRLSVDLVEYPNSKDIEVYLMYENIDDKKKTDLLTLERAETDPLTGVFNRAAFKSRMEQILASSKPGEQHALFMLDIDDFKQINDTLGHAAGDQVLKDLPNRIQTILRKGDLIGRLGGDEMFVLLVDISGRKAAAKKAQQICSLPFKTSDKGVKITVSMGVAMIPDNGNDFDTLYKKVDDALYQKKRSGKNGFVFYGQGEE